MLFYERIKPSEKKELEDEEAQVSEEEEAPKYKVDLSKELADVGYQLFYLFCVILCNGDHNILILD